MDNQFYIAFAILIPAIIGRVILSNAVKKLTVEKKEALDQSLSGSIILRYAALLIVVISNMFYEKSIFILLPLFLLAASLFYWLKISKIEMPKDYINSFFISVALGIIGVTLFLLLSKEVIFI